MCTRYRLRTHTLAIFAVGVSVPCHQGKLDDASTFLSIGEVVLDFFGWLALRWTGWIARSLGLSMLIYGAIMAKCVASEVGLRQPR